MSRSQRMYTLQILDAGQTFLHPIGDRPVTIGAAADADVRLSEIGVAERHARIEPTAAGATLLATAPVRINGAQVDAAHGTDLQLGDRIEIGRAVLVVGCTVARAAGPEDVLAGSLATRSGRRARRSGGAARWVPIVSALLIVATVIAFALQSDDSGRVRGELAYVDQLRAKGQLDDARRVVARLQREWAEAEDDRLLRLDAAEEEIAQVDAKRAELIAAIVDPTDTRSYAGWTDELLRLEQAGSADERVAARQVRSQLRATLRERDERAREIAIARNGADGTDASGAVAGAMAAGNGSDGATDALQQTAAADPGWLAANSAEVERFCAAGMYSQALSWLQAGFAQAPDADAVAAWRDLEQSVRRRAAEALTQLLAQGREAAADGRVEHAIALLQSMRHRFPTTVEFRQLTDELASLEARAEAGSSSPAAAEPPSATAVNGPVSESTRLATLASLRSQMDAVRAAEERDAFDEASGLLRAAAQAVRSRDADFADRLLVRADEAELLAIWHEAVAAAVHDGRKLTTTDAGGRTLALRPGDGRTVQVRSPDGDRQLSWRELDAAGVQALVRQLPAHGRTALGAATLLYRQGESTTAEAVLAEVLGRDSALQPDIERVIARGRGESADEHGYVLVKGAFVAGRQIEIEKRARLLAKRLETALRAKDHAVRDAFVSETLAVGGIETQALAVALREHLVELRDRLQDGALAKQVTQLVGERERLDEARRHAKELIFDEVRYFYPYKPPAVSGEKFAEYSRVQAEIDRRSAALHDLWHGSRTKLRVPARLGEELAQQSWLADQVARLGGFAAGESAATVLAPLAWARALPPGATVGLQDFCLTPAERATREQWRHVEAFNELIGKNLSPAQRELLRITNDYRVMFGHRPLAAVDTCCAASQGHADEMSRLGYFSHTSPTPGLRTPYDRMRNAGYMFGVSENIATTGGALAAHHAWCHSSGHHRNLLDAGHREVGIGASGRYYVQNFGSGEVHRSLPEWAAVEKR